MTSGKLKPKPDDTHRKQLANRAKDHIALVNKIVPDRLLKTPSQTKSERMKKKLRNRDGKKCPYDFSEPEVLK
jgi:hypothetical protein